MKKVQKEVTRLKDCIDELLFFDGEDMEREVKRAYVENRITQEIATNFLKNTELSNSEIAKNIGLSELEVENLKRKIDEGRL